MKQILYILYICGLIACQGNTERSYPRYDTFPDEKAIFGEVIPLDTAVFQYPFRITIQDNIVIILDLHNADNFFHAFTFPDWKYLTSFGTRGEAPEEMLSAADFQFISKDSIWTLDANKMELSRWGISVENKSAERKEIIPLAKELITTLNFAKTESGFLVPDFLGKHRFHRLNPEGIPIESQNKIPTENTYTDIALPALAQAWRSFIDYNPKNHTFALATQLGEVLEIYNLNDSTHAILYGPNREPKFKVSGNDGIPTGIMGFSDIQITDKYIYTVFHGRKFKDIITASQRGEKKEDGGRFIYVFDLNGQPVRKYTLDHAIYGIDVHEKEGIIYATDVNSDEPIVKYSYY